MKILHTADWHLGKTLMNRSLIEDQKFIMEKFLTIVDDVQPNAIIIAGDVYDRADPSTEAVDLFDKILFELTERKIPVLCIAGNHDSAERLNFGSRVFANKNFFITAKTADKPENIRLTDDFGDVYFSLIPYFEPAEIRAKFFGDEQRRLTFDEANKFYIDEVRKEIPAGARSVAIAHVFISGGETSDSERKFVGGAGNVSLENFAGYDYVALGHLHRAQKMSAENIRYSGSPLKYSASEASHEKGVTLVELDANGFVSAKNIPLKPLHDLIVVEGESTELQSRPPCYDYVYVTLTDKTFFYDAAQKLRDAFPNLMNAQNQARSDAAVDAPTRKFRENVTILEQFADFFEEMTKRELTDDERAAMTEICGG